jgi:inner membrane protein
MPTIATHAFVATALYTVLPRQRWNVRLCAAGIFCAMVPDVDVIGFPLGVRYGDLLGHRGLSHSLSFAALAAVVAARQFPRDRLASWWFLFVCTASHGLLDAATDGGLGIAFWSPFSNERYFWPRRPIRVAPIGLTRLWSTRARDVIATELTWIWLPCAAAMLGAYLKAKRSLNSQLSSD